MPVAVPGSPSPTRSVWRRRGVLLAGVAALAVAALALLVVALFADDEATTAAGSSGALSVAGVLGDPQRYAGREITVTGRADVLTDRAMSLGEGDLIVVARSPGASPFEGGALRAGARITVTGRLRILSAQELVERLPHTSLLPSQFQGFDRQPVLIAERATAAG